jgi:hypothetical protein
VTLSELKRHRVLVPFGIFQICAVPLGFFTKDEPFGLIGFSLTQSLALVATFFYVGLDVRGWFWRREIDKHVGQQIRDRLLALIPADLSVTALEIQQLREWEVFKKLTGVFWEAIDRDEQLTRHKQHFYANGIIYTTSLDVYLIALGAALVYAVTCLITWRLELLPWAVIAIALSLASRLLVTPSARRRHVQLSHEQLDLLERNQRDFVQSRFREIVTEWRRRGVEGSSRPR